MAFVFSLLVIVLITTAPPSRHALLFDLPQASFLEIYAADHAQRAMLPDETRLDVGVNIITISETGQVYWNDKTIDERELRGYLQATLMQDPEPRLLFQPDPLASYNSAAQTLKIIKASMVTKFAFAGLRQHCRFGKAEMTSPTTGADAGLRLSLSLIDPFELPPYSERPLRVYTNVCPDDG